MRGLSALRQIVSSGAYLARDPRIAAAHHRL